MNVKAIETSYAGCRVDGCTEEVRAKGLCRLHWERQHKTGTTDAPPRLTGVRNPRWKGSDATYSAIHLRMSNGPRPDSCENCGAVEGRFEWALRADAPAEALLYSPEGYPYSADPAHYANLCKTCHNQQDLGTDVCIRGHLVVGANAYIQPSNGKRFCRECQRIRRRARTERESSTEAARARDWAAAEGIQVASTGRLPVAILTAGRSARFEHSESGAPK